VNGVSWHPNEAWLLSTASFDKTISLIDCRSVSITKACSIPSDVEALLWDPFQSYHLYASLENGQVLCLDIRNIDQMKHHSKSLSPYLSFQAHETTVCSMSFSPTVKGMLATASLDSTVKIWDVSNLHEVESHHLLSSSSSAESGKKSKKSSSSSSGSSSSIVPKCIAYKTMNVGKLFSLRFHNDNPFLLATAGDQAKVAIWESDEMEIIKNHFQNSVYEIDNPYLQLERQQSGRQHDDDLDEEYHFLPRPEKQRVNLTITNDYVESQKAQLSMDEEWMNDNSGIAGNSSNNDDGEGDNSEKKKKKKKKSVK
jgi:WD40 repeat protein